MIFEESEQAREFSRLYKEFDDIYHEAALRLGISDSAMLILSALIRLGDGCLQKDISDLYFISRQTINTSVKKLEKENLIELRPGRRRDMHIYLTADGEEFVRKKLLPAANAENAVLAEMKPGESAELLRLTRIYVSGLREKLLGPGAPAGGGEDGD